MTVNAMITYPIQNLPLEKLPVKPPSDEQVKEAAKKVVEVAKDVAKYSLLGPLGTAACLGCHGLDMWDKLTRDNPGPEMVDKTLKTGDMEKFAAMANELTSGELEETADHIVKKMANEPNLANRKSLQKMHTIIRAEEKSREWNFDFKWPETFDPKWILA